MDLIFFKLGQVCGFVKLVEFALPAGQQFRQFSGGAFVAPGQADPERQTFIKLSETLWFQFGVARIAVQRMNGVFDLRQRAAQNLAKPFEFGFYVRLIL